MTLTEGTPYHMFGFDSEKSIHSTPFEPTNPGSLGLPIDCHVTPPSELPYIFPNLWATRLAPASSRTSNHQIERLSQSVLVGKPVVVRCNFVHVVPPFV